MPNGDQDIRFSVSEKELDDMVKKRVFALEATLAVTIKYLLNVPRMELPVEILKDGEQLAARLHREVLPDGTNIWTLEGQ